LRLRTANGPHMASPGDKYFRYVLRKPLTPARAGWAIALATGGVTIACGAVIRLVDPSDFDNVWLGLWWAVQTVTTVGYGDVVPEHTFGRIIATVLMLSGIGFLTVVTAVITAALIETVSRRLGDPKHAELVAKLDELSARLQALESTRGR
jgi:voltage-gated potassium channel